MIPGKIVRFLEPRQRRVRRHPPSDLVPHGHRVSGWSVGADGGTLTVLIAERVTADLLASLEDNGQLSLTVEEFPSHETYQFKGRYLRHRPLEPDDLEDVAGIRARFVAFGRSSSDAPEAML